MTRGAIYNVVGSVTRQARSAKPTATMHISENTLEGSLLDSGLDEVLKECHAHLVTGTLSINAGGKQAILEIRAGAVDSIDYLGLGRAEALEKLHALKDGEFELRQKLPTLSGELADAASLETDSDEVSVVKLMQLCEDNALSCTITVTTDEDTAKIIYKAGDIETVEWNGEANEYRITDVVGLEHAKVRVEAPPLQFGILSWPSVRDDPTPAFIPIKEMAEGRVEPESAKAKKARKAEGTAKTRKTSGPVPPHESSGVLVLLGLVVGLLVLAAALAFAAKALTGA